MLINLYQQQLDLFKQLGKLSQSMTEFAPSQLVEDDAVGDAFLKLLDERTVIMGKIDQLSEEIQAQGVHMTDGDDAELGLIKRALELEIKSLQGQNAKVESLIKRSLGQLREEAKKLQSGKKIEPCLYWTPSNWRRRIYRQASLGPKL